MESVLWAIKHTMRDIAEIGLNREWRRPKKLICSAGDDSQSSAFIVAVALEILRNFAKCDPNIANSFYRQFHHRMLEETFAALTDADHKSGKPLCLLLSRACLSMTHNPLSLPRFQAAKHAVSEAYQSGRNGSHYRPPLGPGTDQ
jgi:exportin-1